MGNVVMLDNDCVEPWLARTEFKIMVGGLPRIRASRFQYLPMQNYDV